MADPVLLAAGVAPVASAEDGTTVWYAMRGKTWDAAIGTLGGEWEWLLPPYDGNRAPADITPDGRYVILTTAVGIDRTLFNSGPGMGGGNQIELLDRQTGQLTVLWPSGETNG
jgi:hypothetical protein